MRKGPYDKDLLIIAAIMIIFVIGIYKTIEEHQNNQRVIIPQIEKKIQGR